MFGGNFMYFYENPPITSNCKLCNWMFWTFLLFFFPVHPISSSMDGFFGPFHPFSFRNIQYSSPWIAILDSFRIFRFKTSTCKSCNNLLWHKYLAIPQYLPKNRSVIGRGSAHNYILFWKTLRKRRHLARASQRRSLELSTAALEVERKRVFQNNIYLQGEKGCRLLRPSPTTKTSSF